MKSMNLKAAASLLALLAASLLAGCGERSASSGNHTAVLGSAAAPAPASAMPAPPAPKGTAPQVVQASPGTGLALWLQDGHVVASSWQPGTGWSAAQPLEQIYGEPSDPQLATDGKGNAMAVWRHTVGSIESLRYSRYDVSGWSVPDVMPGALPRARNEHSAAPRLQMDANGNATAEWASGFDPKQTQTARYVPGEGWSHAVNVASAAPASPAPPSPSSAR